jgi:hypothetical protein
MRTLKVNNSRWVGKGNQNSMKESNVLGFFPAISLHIDSAQLQIQNCLSVMDGKDSKRNSFSNQRNEDRGPYMTERVEENPVFVPS